MFKITGKKNNIIWDPKNNKQLVHLENGCFDTEDTAVVKRLKDLGYEVTEAVDKKEDAGGEKKLEEMNLTELKALAKEKGLQGYSALAKEELLAALKEVV